MSRHRYKIVPGHGEPCPRCKFPTEIREHAVVTEKHLSQPYYFSRWFYCLNERCPTTLIMVERFKITKAGAGDLGMRETIPLPWKYYPGSRGIYSSRHDPNAEKAVAVMCGPRNSSEQADANAKLILRAVEITDKLARFDPGWECRFCGEYANSGNYRDARSVDTQVVEKHASDCLWRMAKEAIR